VAGFTIGKKGEVPGGKILIREQHNDDDTEIPVLLLQVHIAFNWHQQTG
jgi:hypothetical protein